MIQTLSRFDVEQTAFSFAWGGVPRTLLVLFDFPASEAGFFLRTSLQGCGIHTNTGTFLFLFPLFPRGPLRIFSSSCISLRLLLRLLHSPPLSLSSKHSLSHRPTQIRLSSNPEEKGNCVGNTLITYLPCATRTHVSPLLMPRDIF
ncbi:hypothetical protein BS17DRAFT_381940 [Gyrodon lividus]|nr:hypothetical protein BS17DRAFT_381940 [Gyrodon lividus]